MVNSVKKPPTKQHIRSEIDAQIAEFLSSGGEVVQIERGVSGRPHASAPLRLDKALFDKEPSPRTFLPEVVAELDERAKANKQTKPASKRQRVKARKVPVYDDFGEILRWEWKDDAS